MKTQQNPNLEEQVLSALAPSKEGHETSPGASFSVTENRPCFTIEEFTFWLRRRSPPIPSVAGHGASPERGHFWRNFPLPLGSGNACFWCQARYRFKNYHQCAKRRVSRSHFVSFRGSLWATPNLTFSHFGRLGPKWARARKKVSEHPPSLTNEDRKTPEVGPGALRGGVLKTYFFEVRKSCV